MEQLEEFILGILDLDLCDNDSAKLVCTTIFDIQIESVYLSHEIIIRNNKVQIALCKCLDKSKSQIAAIIINSYYMCFYTDLYDYDVHILGMYININGEDMYSEDIVNVINQDDCIRFWPRSDSVCMNEFIKGSTKSARK